MNLWDVGDSNPLTAKPIHRFVKAEWFYRPLMLTSQFVAPTGLEPVTPGLKDRCARYRSPIAPRGRSIFLAPTPLKGRHYCLQYRFIFFISFVKYTNLYLYFKISAGVIGLEPTTVGLTGRCSQPIIATLPYFAVHKGVEPSPHGRQPRILHSLDQWTIIIFFFPRFHKSPYS